MVVAIFHMKKGPNLHIVVSNKKKVTDFFPRAGNGGTGCRLYPRRSLRRLGGAQSASGAGGSRAFAPRLSPRSSSSGVPPVVLGSHGLDCCAVR